MDTGLANQSLMEELNTPNTLPQVKVFEFTLFIQIKFGNPNSIENFIGLMT